MIIPVHIIAGFLGSGKTTLMNHLLKMRPEGLKPAIIVNDFGEIPLDGDLIDRSDYALKELASGCVCCTLKGPLSETLAVFAKEEAPDVILMETTGVAIPAEIGGLFQTLELKSLVQIGNVICVIDTNSFLKYEPHFSVIGTQIQQANTIVLNKADLTSQDRLNAVYRRIEYLCLPESQIVETNHGKLYP
ncbi:MAG: GTP-binding protein, partial [Candidatus Latescibacteria bacterium]|nr:GTP-binding protein [Candidatus Latescibacterota bacterium]